MPGFDHNRFKEALKKVQEEKHELLMQDLQKVKAGVEKMLTLFLESSANVSRVNYSGALE